MFELLDEFINEKPRNMDNVIQILLGYVDGDPWFETDAFEQAVRHALEKIEEDKLFETLKIPLDCDKRNWTKDYYVHLRLNLESNFSKQGIEHLYKVAREIYNQLPESDEEQVNDSKKEKRFAKKKLLIIFTIVLILAISLILIKR